MRKNSAKPRWWGGAAAMSVLALVVAILGLVLVQGGVRAQGTFEPTVDVELSNYDSGVNADLTTTFSVPGTDYNYAVFVSFTPPEFFPDEDVPIGAKVGELDAVATLGLLNMPCSTLLGPHFDLYWASTDTSDTITYTEQWANDPTHPGLHDGIHHYPDFIDRLLPGTTPLQRMYGYANVSGSDVTINFVVLEPGDLAGYPAAWGRPSVTVLNDIGDPAAEPTPGDPITDFCTPLSTDIVTFGLSKDNPETGDDEAGYEVRRNPAYGGTYTFRWYGESFMDADGDGYENFLDTCPFDVNLDDSPKLPTGDPDGDGIDSACDLDPAVACWAPVNPLFWFNDCDQEDIGGGNFQNDGFYNRADNCPTVRNPLQEDADSDQIGDACDLHPNTPDGVPIEWEDEADVDISGPEPGQDSDDDGFDDVEEGELGSCPDDPCTNGFCSGVKAADSTPEHTDVAGTCTDDEDNDKDGYIDDFDGGCEEDTDEDGVSDEGEDELGSDPDDANSTPEDARVCDVCTDGKDNDGDGLKDAEDEGCKVAATPTPTATPAAAVETTLTKDASAGDTQVGVADTTGFAEGDTIEIGAGDTKETNTITAINGGSAGTFTLATPLQSNHAAGERVLRIAAATPTATPTVEGEFCPPQIPGTYHGLVHVDGQPALSGYELTASIDNVQWGSAIVSGGRYAMEIPDYLPVQEPCFQAGTITFELDGMICVPVQEGADEWAAGLQNVDLNCSPPATPTATATPAPPPTTATPIPPTATPIPTASPTPTSTPVKPPPTGTGGLAGPSQGLPLWAMALAGWAGLMTVAGLGTLVAVKRR